MRFLRIKDKINLPNILKVFVSLAIVLIITAVVIGMINFIQTKQERKAIADINISIANEGLAAHTKELIQNYSKKYPQTKNIIVCDSLGNVLFKANDQLLNGKTTFVPESVEGYVGIFKQKNGNSWFVTDFKDAFPLRLKPDMRGGSSKNQGRVMGGKPFGARENRMQKGRTDRAEGFLGQEQYVRSHIESKDKLFLNNYTIKANDKEFNVYFISTSFRENGLMKVIFVINAAFRMVLMLLWVLVAVWVFLDSRERRLHYVFWGLLSIITGFIGLVIYLVFKNLLHFCHSCKSNVSKDSNFCPACGSGLKLKCSSCGQTMKMGNDYCPNCGVKQE